ncbi:MAG: molybdopterin-dependent oxidoreductase [Acidimicrobiales bacterium]|nr:molybdopterin-dependent oxidoreductase [Acidimicrobiales bacterium]RZV48741.1 MAG: molybdopterin oxidoreductase family protein [Acidimicrobiales bacterium]
MTTVENRRTTVLGTCHHDCPDTCGWIATAEDGVLIEVKGNPDHPYSDGQLCPKINRLVHRVNSDDRILTPLIRSGPKGTGQFRESSWEEALNLVVERTNAARAEFGGETILPWNSAGTQGHIQESSLDRALFTKLGSSRQTGSICGVATGAGMAMTYGGVHGADPLNVEHSDFVILWATNTKLTNRHLWPYVQKARERGAPIVVIDSMRTMTADAADIFIQPLPGTDVALMLAVMHVLIAENLIDHEYVNSHADGFGELAESVAEKTPEWGETQCGVAAEEIRQLARAYGGASAPFIRTLIGAEHHESGAMFYRTIACLPVLTGAWRHLGGGVARSCGSLQYVDDVSSSVFDHPHLGDGSPRRGLPQPQLGRSLTTLDDPPVSVLFVWGGNPLNSLPNAAATRRGLERDDLFTVVSEQMMTDTARYADVVFPAATQTENLDIVPSWGHLWLGYNEPATAPRGEAVANTELWRRLSRAFGFTEPELFLSDEELIDAALAPHVDRDALRRDGFVRISGTTDHLPYADGGFGTHNGKAQLANPLMETMGLPSLPTFYTPTESMGNATAAYPLHLLTPKKQLRFLNTTYSGSAGHVDRERGPFLEMDAADAETRGLQAGDMARVFNDRGELELEVAITDRLRPGLVSVPWGFWAANYGSTGAVVNDLTNDGDTDWGGGAAYGDTLVDVQPCRRAS